MKNFVQSGGTITFTAATAIQSGQGVMQGAFFGVACTSAEIGQDFEAALVGVFELPKDDTPFTKGQRAYWTAQGAVSSTATDNTLIGAATEAAAEGTAAVRIRLNGTA